VAIDPDQRILRADQITTVTQPLPSYPTIAAFGPNPTSGTIEIQYLIDRDGRVDINVFDVAGRRVLSQTVASASVGVQFLTIDTSPLSSGVYFLRLSTAQGQAHRKFVVVR